jgi:protein-S-isoprenylcysteine O-methyltransferase Ste14
MDNERVLFLVIGVVIVVAVGQLLAMSGRRYLANSAPNERESSSSAATLVAVLFHLVTLGIVALLTVVSFGGSPEQGLLLRLGVLLIALALVFGVTLTLLSRRRQEALATEIDNGRVVVTEEPRVATVRVRPADDAEDTNVEPWNHPMDPNAGTAMGQPYQDRSL